LGDGEFFFIPSIDGQYIIIFVAIWRF